jgi:hypothetical protein
MNNQLHQLFELLDRWRHLPAYQLERRADIFFALYLPELLTDRFDVELAEVLIPEFPIKRDLIWPEYKTNQSVKVDYVALTKDRGQCFFVELKTDVNSRRDAQDEYLEVSKEIGLCAILEGLTEIVQATTAHQKYFSLLAMLEDADLLVLPQDLADYVFPQGRPGLRSLQESIEVTVDPGEFDIEVVYVQPNSPADGGQGAIGFEEMAAWLRGRGELADMFATYLTRWTSSVDLKYDPSFSAHLSVRATVFLAYSEAPLGSASSGCQCCPLRAIALRITRSFRIQATTANFFGLPRSTRRL